VLKKLLLGLLISIVVGAALVVVIVDWPAKPSAAAQAEPPPPARTYAPSANLTIKVSDSQTKTEALLADGAAWKQAPATAVLLSRSPRIYHTEPIQNRPVPQCEVRVLRASGRLYLRLQWDDPTENAPKAPPARSGEDGEAKLLYKRPTGATAAFADAAAVMVPDGWIGPEFPSLLMGDRHAPAKLYYWNASTGAEVLKSSGRATPQPVGQTVPHRARHTKAGWTVILELPDLPAGYPIAFALWDGEFGDRDGLKFFSIWYVLLKE
jgi:hypothetical protein